MNANDESLSSEASLNVSISITDISAAAKITLVSVTATANPECEVSMQNNTLRKYLIELSCTRMLNLIRNDYEGDEIILKY